MHASMLKNVNTDSSSERMLDDFRQLRYRSGGRTGNRKSKHALVPPFLTAVATVADPTQEAIPTTVIEDRYPGDRLEVEPPCWDDPKIVSVRIRSTSDKSHMLIKELDVTTSCGHHVPDVVNGSMERDILPIRFLIDLLPHKFAKVDDFFVKLENIAVTPSASKMELSLSVGNTKVLEVTQQLVTNDEYIRELCGSLDWICNKNGEFNRVIDLTADT